MSISYQTPQPPHFATSNPVMFTAGVLMGFVFLLLLTVVVDKLGSAMFRRGFAKPFYIKGRRIHHRVIYMIVPTAYGIFSILYILGHITLTWHAFWGQLGILAAIVAMCVSVDAIGDKFWPEIRKNVIFHHEWVYSLIPAYMFAVMITIVI